MRVLGRSRGVEDAVALLDRAEQEAGAPLVDEAERARLEALATDRTDRDAHWHGLLARREDQAVGYVGLVLDPDGNGGEAVGDLVVARDHAPCEPVVGTLLRAVEALGWEHAVARVVVWIRHASPTDVACGVDHGYGVDRRLAVLGRRLERPPARPDVPEGHRLRRFRPGEDDEAVVGVLRAAYAGTPDAGWNREELAQRRSYDWFRPEDLLLLEGRDGVVGLHWTKRRGDGRGEVYNLAVDPGAQGTGLGGALLQAGLRHLWDVGCRDVLLWVDLANERAVRLYASHGFRIRWEDLAFSRVLCSPPGRRREPGRASGDGG